MRPSHLHLTLLLVFALAIMIACGGDNSSGPSEEANLVWVDSVSATPGSQAIVNIYVRNDSEIKGVEVPLRLSGTGFVIDSGSFFGGRFSEAELKSAEIDTEANTIFPLVIGVQKVFPKGEGVFARIYVSLDEAAVAQEITVDSALVQISGNVYHVVSYARSDLTQVLPPFEPGKIVVEQ